jgi:hypothetical protein
MKRIARTAFSTASLSLAGLAAAVVLVLGRGPSIGGPRRPPLAPSLPGDSPVALEAGDRLVVAVHAYGILVD